jgi:phosphoribosyl-ATP pyrophosphohydrolase
MAKKLAEEAVEVVIDAMHGNTEAVVKESADLMYNLVVLWVAAGIDPKDVWAEMERREQLMGIAEKLPKRLLDKRLHQEPLEDKQMTDAPAARRKIVNLESRRLPKRR